MSVPREDFGKYLDLDDVMKRLGGKRALLDVLLKKHLADTSESSLKEALAAGDHESAKAVIHAMKGTAGNLSLCALQEAAAALEAVLKEGGEPGGLPEKLYEINAATAFVIQTMLQEG